MDGFIAIKSWLKTLTCDPLLQEKIEKATSSLFLEEIAVNLVKIKNSINLLELEIEIDRDRPKPDYDELDFINFTIHIDSNGLSESLKRRVYEIAEKNKDLISIDAVSLKKS